MMTPPTMMQASDIVLCNCTPIMIHKFYAWLMVRVEGDREMQSNGPVNVEALQSVGIQRGRAPMQLHSCMQFSCLADRPFTRLQSHSTHST